ncbi:MAG: cysteine--tRNA ligase [Chloroflexi bacterium]|nr:cysteine--tRNA ligase [Chloroflexota bacterium]MCH8875255.1 cysteine--tRNA ligase [Chloroflexota bacterium]
MKLYSSFTQEMEDLELSSDPPGIYACGITPYDTTHLGHAFNYCAVDVLIRFLEYTGSSPRYVQNVTDIDDDMLREAAKRDEDWKRLGDRWTELFIEDMIALNVRPPDEMPRASSVIPDIVKAVEGLIDTGHAYVGAGSVYYDLESWPDYGRLSKLSKVEMLPIANERGNLPDDPNKRQPLDFVLWQAQQAGEPAWESPWGPGRPGWHIECSVLAGRLGETLDVHVGGGDLVFPHHESEIAQSEALHGVPLSRVWMHIGMVEHEGEKMSKSLGNLVLIRDLLDDWSPNTIRLYLSRHHYRERWSHSEQELATSAEWADAMSRAVQEKNGPGPELDLGDAQADFGAAMEADLNSVEAIQVLLRLAQEIQIADDEGHAVGAAQELLKSLAGVLGLRLTPGPPAPDLVKGWHRHL